MKRILKKNNILFFSFTAIVTVIVIVLSVQSVKQPTRSQSKAAQLGNVLAPINPEKPLPNTQVLLNSLVTFTWTPVPLATGYEFQISRDPNFTTLDFSTNLSLDTPPKSDKTKKLRVLEVRYFPPPRQAPYEPDLLSSQLQQYLRTASISKGFLNPSGPSKLDVEIVDVINVNSLRPNPDGTYYSSNLQMINDLNLCDRIINEDIDQIWQWVDPIRDKGPGLEYYVSSPYNSPNYESMYYGPKPAYCNGRQSFVIMSFDYTRMSDQALHSFGHYMEATSIRTQGSTLFWYRFDRNGVVPTGSGNNPSCGNVHFPPNATVDYQYNNTTTITNYCENWSPNATVDNTPTLSINCMRWKCTHEGFLTWWLQNFPTAQQNLTYQDLLLPTWLEFAVDYDETVESYLQDPSFFFNRSYFTVPSNYKPIVRNQHGATYTFRNSEGQYYWRVRALNLTTPITAWGTQSVMVSQTLPSPTPSPTPTIVPSPTPSPTVNPSPTTIPTNTPYIIATPTKAPSPTIPTGNSPTPTVIGACREDINQDSLVDLSDYVVLALNFLKTTPTNPRADINSDGIVDIADYAALALKFLRRCN